ncbi:MAG TPA: ABC transporter permease, partial [Terriglobales bacterium]|nr:ABC transporter permease [Terriglobales bacterium]
MQKLPGWLWQDLRFAIRSIKRDRSFTALAVLALALGIGSVTVIFSAVYGVLIDTFPYAHFDRMVSFSIDVPGQRFGQEFLTVPELLDFRDQNHVFEDMEGGTATAVHYIHGNQTTQWTVTRETANGYQFFGVQPLLGRLITPADAQPNSPPVFMMTYQLWKNQFDGDPGILGKTFNLDGTFYTLIGIMPPRFRAGWNDIYTAFPMNRAAIANDPTLKNTYVWPLGFLKPGVTVAQAAADLDIVAHRLAKMYPDQFPKQFRVSARSFQDRVTPMFTSVLYPLLGAVLLLFLIACTNVANLLLTRATARDREIAVRASLGATRWRLIRQLLVESLVLAAAGCAVGCLFAYLGIRELVPLIPYNNFPQESVIELNWIVLLAAMGLAFIATIICGLFPAVRVIGGPLQPRLVGSGTTASAGLRHGRVRSALVVAEVALSLVLLAGAGLLLRSFFGITHANLGYDPKKILAADLQFPPGAYDKPEQIKLFFDELVTKIKNMPGVLDATVALSPRPGGFPTAINIPGAPQAKSPEAEFNVVDPEYFHIFNYNLLRGRTFSDGDLAGQRKIAVVNEAFAHKFFSKNDPLGQTIDFPLYDEFQQHEQETAAKKAGSAPPAPTKTYFEVVGVVSNVRSSGIEQEVRPAAFLPTTIGPQFNFSIAVQTARDADLFSGEIARQIWAMNRDITLMNDRGSLESRLQKYDYARPQFEFIMLSTFAAVGLLLVIIGVYGVMAYNVSLQTREIGIRMALGAQQSDVVLGVIRRGTALIGMGAVLGLVL